jgi:hypothetical protein
VAHGIRLHLQGSFDDLGTKHFPWQPDIILGEVNGRQVTLHQCWRYDVQKLPSGSSVPSDAIYAAEVAFVGIHLGTPGDVQFSVLDVSCAGMPYWFGVMGFSCGDSHRTTFADIGTVAVGDLDISLVADFRQNEDAQLCLSGEKLLFVRMVRRTPLAFAEWRAGPIRLLQDFLAFATGADCPPVRIRIPSDGVSDSTTEGLCDVDAYVYGMDCAGAELIRPDYLFHAHDAKNPGNCIGEWFGKSQRLRTARELYCDVIRRGPSLSLTMRFFLLMLALEGYHRSTQDGKYLPDDDFELIRMQLSRAVGCSVTGDLRNSLQQRLRFGNEFSLRRRLKGLVRLLGCRLGTIDVPVDEMVDARNDFAHPESQGVRRVWNDVELSVLADYAQALAQACLLTEIGLPEDTVAEALSDNQRYAAAQVEWSRLHRPDARSDAE